MRTIAELSAEANRYEFLPHISFATWAAACRAMLREARIYDQEGGRSGHEHAYILYLRCADLVVNKLCGHPQLKTHKAEWQRLLSEIKEPIERSDWLKQEMQQELELKSLEKEEELVSKDKEDDFILRELKRYENQLDKASSIDLGAVNTLQRLQTTAKSSYNVPLASKPSTEPVAGTKSVFETSTEGTLREVFVPSELRSRFLQLAEANTSRNLETCGILFGQLHQNKFQITDLVVPHQHSTSDSCGTTNEEELFTYADKRELFIVGWIHTHPTQTCFMSSVDLHTHAAYQLMLPESVAVVCAPKSNPSWGAFRLTDPPGMGVIRKCTERGFHPHDDAETLYCKPSNYVEGNAPLQVVDLR